MKTIVHLALGGALALTACSKPNPYYCEGQPDNLCASTDGGPMGCDDSTDCTDSKAPVCDTSAHVCVACTDGQTAACTDNKPVCSNHECVACTSHDQCDSNVCLFETGACAMPADVAYVTSTGAGTSCTAGEPCSFTTAIAGPAPYVRILDASTIAIPGMTISRDVSVFGEGAKIDPSGDGPLFTIASGASVALYDLELRGATSALGNAIDMAGSKLTLARMRIADNQGMGVNATAGLVTITRSTFTVNDRGAISLGDNVQFSLTNNFIFRNGNGSSATVGGVKLSPALSGTRVFEFNTVVDNNVKTGSFYAGGVACGEPTFAAPNNIIARNYVNNSAAAANANWNGDCAHPTSIITSDIAILMFVSPDTDAPFNYRLQSTSNAIDQATTASSTLIDVDGDARPQGNAPDIGADEYK